MKLQQAILTILLSLCLASSVFAAEKSIKLRLESSPKANTQGKQAVPLPVSVFLLAGTTRFNKANYFNLEDSSRRALGGEYLTKRSLVLLPNRATTVTLPNNNEARYVGFVGGYNSLKGKRWRRSVALSKLDSHDLTVRYNNTGVVLRYQKKMIQDRQGLYVDGALGYNLTTVESDDFEYTPGSTARLGVDKTSSFGQLGMGVGYEWQRGENNWLNTLHLEKVSAGVGVYFIPEIKLEGGIVQSGRANRAYTLKTSAELAMLEAKINFLRLGHFTTFLNTGFGSARYQNTYERKASSGPKLSTENDNSSMIYKLGLGEEYDLTNKLSLSLGYDYYSPTELEVKEIRSSGATVHSDPKLTVNNSTISFHVHYFFDNL